MNPLTADEMACVAKEVTGLEHKHGVAPFGDRQCTMRADASGFYEFDPDFNGSDNQRNKALAVVEWLFEAIWERSIDQSKEETFGMLVKFGVAVIAKDTTALQRMVLELRNPQ